MLVPVIRAAGSTKTHRGSATYDGTPAIRRTPENHAS
jgi:hypothetical protein